MTDARLRKAALALLERLPGLTGGPTWPQYVDRPEVMEAFRAFVVKAKSY